MCSGESVCRAASWFTQWFVFEREREMRWDMRKGWLDGVSVWLRDYNVKE
jgi:hypothetical protein